jgi:hypothetical protein
MGAIEGLWFTLIGVFIFLGIIRGFLKELGLTTVMIVFLFAMDQLVPRLEELIAQPDSFFQRIGITPETRATPLWLFLTLLVVLVVYISYEGETLAFEGTPPKGFEGFLLGALIGFINGYLVCGTLWWILHRYNYPIRATGLFVDFAPGQTLSPLATQIVDQLRLLPPDLLGQGVESATSLGVLPLLVITMVLLRVVR